MKIAIQGGAGREVARNVNSECVFETARSQNIMGNEIGGGD